MALGTLETVANQSSYLILEMNSSNVVMESLLVGKWWSRTEVA